MTSLMSLVSPAVPLRVPGSSAAGLDNKSARSRTAIDFTLPSCRRPTRTVSSRRSMYRTMSIRSEHLSLTIDPARDTKRILVPKGYGQQMVRHRLVAHRPQEPLDGGGAHRGVERGGRGGIRAAVLHRLGHGHTGGPAVSEHPPPPDPPPPSQT